jgi:hypothetical protein
VWLALLPVVLVLLALVGVVAWALSQPEQPPPARENERRVEDRRPTVSPGNPPPKKAPPREKKDRKEKPSVLPEVPPEVPADPNGPAQPDDVGVRPRPQESGREGPPVLTVPDFVMRDVEVVFCIDTTGSMGGLISGAQDKIWAICNQIAGGKPVPALKVGLVAYRDKGDEYVTKVFDLTRDLDAMHQELLGLKAAGGGDTPESVNKGLFDATNKVRWSTDKKTLRILFLVGDAPPHMDYPDDVKYPQTCQKAVEKGIIINTIQCGNDFECKRYWMDIAAKAGGEYVAIPQAGGVRVVETPFDDRLAELLGELMSTALLYGNAGQKQAGQRMLNLAKELRGAAAADRAAFAAKSKNISPYDLLDAIRMKRVKLEAVKFDELPASLQKLRALAERQAELARVAARREKLQAEALDLERKRAEHIRKALKDGGKDSFDSQVLGILRKQAKKFDIEY